jgi:hypothetical protein
LSLTSPFRWCTSSGPSDRLQSSMTRGASRARPCGWRCEWWTACRPGRSGPDLALAGTGPHRSAPRAPSTRKEQRADAVACCRSSFKPQVSRRVAQALARTRIRPILDPIRGCCFARRGVPSPLSARFRAYEAALRRQRNAALHGRSTGFHLIRVMRWPRRRANMNQSGHGPIRSRAMCWDSGAAVASAGLTRR